MLPCLAACVPVTVHKVEKPLDVWHGLQQRAVDSTIDRDASSRLCMPYGPKEDFSSSDNMLIEQSLKK